MAGHSKWSKVKHQKAVTDKAKGKAFSKASKAIAIAIKEGGGEQDPSKNFKLRLAVEQAKASNVPKETINRAINKASSDTATLEQIIYEGYGPGGVGLIMETATDNRQRTVAFIKTILTRHEGSLAEPGAVMYLFDKKGRLAIAHQENVDYDKIFALGVEYGAQEVNEGKKYIRIITDVENMNDIAIALEKSDVTISSQEIVYIPKIEISLNDDQYQLLQSAVEQLDDLDDVLQVYTAVKPMDE